MLKLNLTSRIAVCLVSVMALSSSAYAQSADTGAATTGTEAEAEATTETQAETGTQSQIESQLSMGQDADAPNDLGQPYTKEEVGDWELRCLRTENPDNDPCQLYQLLDDGEGVPVAEFSLFRLPGTGQAKAGATVIVPLETALPNQLTIRIDGGAAKRYPYAFCNQLGCYARIGLTEEDVNAFKRGKEATMTIIPALAPDQEVVLSLSLSGFTAGYDKASVIEQ